MPLRKEVKNLNNFDNDPYILNQYIVPYNIASTNRYKHIDEVTLADGKTIKHTLSPIDMNVLAYNQTSRYVVTASDEHRIDIIAYNIYGASSFYWVLCYMNRIKDPLNIPEGTILEYPVLSDLTMQFNPLY